MRKIDKQRKNAPRATGIKAPCSYQIPKNPVAPRPRQKDYFHQLGQSANNSL